MNLSTRLPAGREARQAELTAPQCFDAIAKRRGPLEVQIRCCRLHVALETRDLRVEVGLGPEHFAFLAQGGRKIDAWYASLQVVEVSFDDEADAFRNINTRDELKNA